MNGRLIASTALLIGTVLGTSPASAADAARVIFSSGDASATGTDGVRRSLIKGTPIRAGDTLDSGKGRTQLRMADGATVALMPGTVFRIDEFRLGNEQTERAYYSLLAGGLRKISGLIGKVRRDNYRFKAEVGTIGIRGTEYSVFLRDGMQVTTADGEIEVCNAAGCLRVRDGQSARVADAGTLPELTTVKTGLAALGAQRELEYDAPTITQDTFSLSDERSAGGDLTVFTPDDDDDDD